MPTSCWRKGEKMVTGKIIDRNYGSIPHLSTSKLSQQADKRINTAQEAILTKKARDWKDFVIVTEKIDGSNVGVYKKNGLLFPVTRAGYHANTSNFKQHIMFDKFVVKNKGLFEWLPENWRVCGEWCVMAHGTKMDISSESPFVAFDIFNDKNKRVLFLDFITICAKYGISTVPILNVGQPVSIKNAIKLIGFGNYGKPEKPEGAVWKVEREGRVDFLAKWVRHDKEDGKYMREDIYNIGSEAYE